MTTFHIQDKMRFGPLEIWPIHWVGPELSTIQLTKEGDLAFAELDDPDPNSITVLNRTRDDLLLPAGQIIGGLRQTRMLPDGVLLPAGTEIDLDVFCVEQGRFHSPELGRFSGRAPISVLLAGRSVDGTAAWGRGSQNRQNHVWESVHRQEIRTGSRPTSSLEQVMREDLRSFRDFREVADAIDANFELNGANGFAISNLGEPVLAEVFSSSFGVEKLAKETLIATLFDLPSINFTPTQRARVQSLLLRLSNQNFKVSENLESGVALSNSDADLECHVIVDSQMRLVNTMLVNRIHPLMQEA